MKVFFRSVAILFIVSHSYGAKLPTYFKQCNSADKNFNDCVIESANNALPTFVKGDKMYQVPVLNPLHLDKVDLDVGDSLKMTFTDVTINGMENGMLKKGTEINLDKKEWTLKLYVPLLSLILNYDIKGRILVLPIVGHGPGNITLEKTNFEYHFDYDLVEKKNTKFVAMKNEKLSFKPGRVYYTLGNLFNGDERLGVEMNRFLNENWSEVLNEIYPALSEVISAVVTSVLKGYFGKIPQHELFHDIN